MRRFALPSIASCISSERTTEGTFRKSWSLLHRETRSEAPGFPAFVRKVKIDLLVGLRLIQCRLDDRECALDAWSPSPIRKLFQFVGVCHPGDGIGALRYRLVPFHDGIDLLLPIAEAIGLSDHCGILLEILLSGGRRFVTLYRLGWRRPSQGIQHSVDDCGCVARMQQP